MRYIAVLIYSLASAGMALQAQEFTYYQASEAFDHSQLKHVMQAVIDQDPSAGVFNSDDMTILQVKSSVLSETEIRSLVTGTGLQLLPNTPDLEAIYGSAPTVPMYFDTGDPAADHARYVAEVNEWNLNNPGQQMPQPLPYADDK